jgi:hypothetical protein
MTTVTEFYRAQGLMSAVGREATFTTIKMVLFERLLCAQERTITQCECLWRLPARSGTTGSRQSAIGRSDWRKYGQKSIS